MTACGGDEEPDITEAQDAVTSATLRLTAAAGSSTDFGSVLPGSHLVETYVVTNAGTRQSSSRLTLSTIGANFSILSPTGGDCVSGTTVLGPRRTCTVRVQFAPTAVGTRAATLSAHAQAGGTASLALSGTGAAPAALVISPANFDFGSVLVGATSAPAVFTVLNTGSAPTGVTTVTSSDPADFVIGASTCSAALAPGVSCTMTVAFRPAIAGLRTAQLTVSASPGGAATATLTGAALRPAALAISPASLVFATTAVGAHSASAIFVVTNTGDTPAGAGGAITATLSGSNPAEFPITSSTCTGILSPGASCSVSVSFGPTSAGSKSALLTVSGSPGGTVVAALAGNGV